MIFILFLSFISTKITKIIDGDTFEGTLGEDTVVIRLIGVDCPESRKNTKAYRDAGRTSNDIETIVALGKLSTIFSKEYLKIDSIVFLEFDVLKKDKYNRILAYVWLNDTLMFNKLILAEGYAQIMTIPPNVKYQKEFLEISRKASGRNKGLWNPLLPIFIIEEEREAESEEIETFYVGNKISKIFHRPNCCSVEQMKENNKIIFKTRKEAIRKGYRECKRCKP